MIPTNDVRPSIAFIRTSNIHNPYSMSLRRSARVASSKAPVVSDPRASNEIAKYEKAAKTTAAPKKRKTKASPTTTSPNEATEDITNGATESISHFATPVTPHLKERKVASTFESPIKPPAFTPTPSGVGLLSHPSEVDHPLESLSGLNTRPAEPHATNAILSTPGSAHHVVAYGSSPTKPEDPTPAKKRKAKELVPPDVGALLPPTSNVDTLLKEAEAFLIKVDPKMKAVVEKHHCKIFSPEGLREVVNPFTALSSGIIGQQVRTCVAL
jgi:DNA-3-methyladenine glycosylase II